MFGGVYIMGEWFITFFIVAYSSCHNLILSCHSDIVDLSLAQIFSRMNI